MSNDEIADDIYGAWKAGDTSSGQWDGWFMVKLSEEIQAEFAKRQATEES